jgi:predicted transcriptional regulator
MAKRMLISRGELDVAQTVWELEQATVGQVHERLSQSKDVDYATVQTYLRRLEQKGYLRTRRVGRNKLYLPKVSRQRVVGQLIDDLLDQLFEGEPLALMQHLIEVKGISAAEIETLRKAVGRLTAAQGKNHKGETHERRHSETD